VPFGALVRVPAVAACVITVVAASATFSMYEPVLALFLADSLGLSPGRVGLVFGAAAVASTVLHPVYGRLADRYGGRRLMVIGLAAAAAVMPLLAQVETFGGAVALYLLQAATLSMVVTPSLAYMAEAGARAGAASFGVSYGLYNFAWGCGLLGGPAVGGVLYERIGFTRLLLAWPLFVVGTAVWLARTGADRVSPPVAIMNAPEDQS
jgi:MFS family permease